MKPFVNRSARRKNTKDGFPVPTKISNTDDFFQFLNSCVQSDKNAMYRGLRKQSHRLIPSIGRHSQKGGAPFTPEREKLMLKLFKQKTYGLTDASHNDLALLTVAQHHGMPTRLMDWTRNPLVAFFFAVRDEYSPREEEEDSIVYFYHPEEKVVLDQDFDPFGIEGVRRFVPRYWSPRIVAQSGLFTVHSKPRQTFRPSGLKNVTIAYGVRKNIKLSLQNLGVHSGSLFPDLDGIARHIGWLRTDMY